jgi:polyhydroxyalkanoate synthesis regulator protein
MTERIITKYANRRLYDTTGSRHITLDDIISAQLLHSIVRFYGTAMEELTARYLEKSVEHLLHQQEMLRAQAVKMMSATPMADFLDLARQNMSLWSEWQKQMFGLPVKPDEDGEKRKK